MQVFHGLHSFIPLETPSVVTLGNFDGVHRGHQALMNQVVTKARSKGAKSVVVTFSPHPIQVLFPERQIEKLFDEKDLESQLRGLQIDILLIIPFDQQVASLKAQDFLDQYVLKKLNPLQLIVGYDFALGSKREGNLDFLKNYCEINKIEFQVVDAWKIKNEVVSSTLIRDKLQNGDLSSANELLGRQFYYRGIVFKGAQRGRTIGVPTANLRATVNLTPKKGVYASWFLVNKKWHASITNVGLNPTVANDDQLKIETHLFNFDEDIYDHQCEVRLVQFIRDEKKFNDFQELKNQIMNDLEMAKRILKNELPPA